MIYFYLFCASLGFLTFSVISRKHRGLIPSALALLIGAGIGVGMMLTSYHNVIGTIQ